jgi:hypothetical protein
MGKSSKIAGDELALTARAIRRAEKLERTLTKLVVIQETGSAAEALLKAVQKGLERLRKDESSSRSDETPVKRKNSKGSEDRKVSQGEPPVAKPSRRSKKSEAAASPSEGQAE